MSDSQRVVLWDFDGTLAAREGMWRGALLTALDQQDPDHGITMDILRARLKNAFPWHSPQVPHLHLGTPDLWWAEMRSQFRRVYASCGVDPTVVEAATATVRDVYLNPEYWLVFDDVRPALQRLRDNGWRHVILSNHVPELDDLVRRIGIGDLVDAVLTSAATGYEKPHPAMFNAALQLMRHPQEVWMVGDNPSADIAGAEAAGIPAILVRTADSTGTEVGLADAVDRILGEPTQLRARNDRSV